MGLVTYEHVFSAGAVIIAAEHNTNFSTLYTLVNGNLDNNNIKSGAAIANAKLDLATITQDIAMSGVEFLFAQGSNEASASTITLDGDGNFYNVTGTTNIQTITIKQAGTIIWLKFGGTLTLVDDTGNLELQGADVVVNNEDVVCLASDGTNWHLISTTSAATNLKIPSEAQGDVLYNNGTIWTRLAAGTDGQFLRTQGSGANPQWSSSGDVLTSATTISGTTTSITIAADNVYRLVARIQGNSSASVEIRIRFNTDSGSNYSWIADGYDHDLTPTARLSGDDSDTEINPTGASLRLGTSKFAMLDMIFMNPDTSDDTLWYVHGTITIDSSDGAVDYVTLRFAGRYDGASAVTSINLVADGGDNTISGTAYLYRLNLA